MNITYIIAGVHEPPNAAKELVTYDFMEVLSKYKSGVAMTSIITFGK